LSVERLAALDGASLRSPECPPRATAVRLFAAVKESMGTRGATVQPWGGHHEMGRESCFDGRWLNPIYHQPPHRSLCSPVRDSVHAIAAAGGQGRELAPRTLSALPSNEIGSTAHLEKMRDGPLSRSSCQSPLEWPWSRLHDRRNCAAAARACPRFQRHVSRAPSVGSCRASARREPSASYGTCDARHSRSFRHGSGDSEPKVRRCCCSLTDEALEDHDSWVGTR
jgi:hypothetical protein